jgi:hypothetical protein
MARFGGLFHLFRTIPKAFKKKRRSDNALHEFRRRLPSPVKNSTAHEWHMTAQKPQRKTRFVPSQNRSHRRRLDIQFRLSNENRRLRRFLPGTFGQTLGCNRDRKIFDPYSIRILLAWKP